jgi:hypothetical protein
MRFSSGFGLTCSFHLLAVSRYRSSGVNSRKHYVTHPHTGKSTYIKWQVIYSFQLEAVACSKTLPSTYWTITRRSYEDYARRPQHRVLRLFLASGTAQSTQWLCWARTTHSPLFQIIPTCSGGPLKCFLNGKAAEVLNRTLTSVYCQGLEIHEAIPPLLHRCTWRGAWFSTDTDAKARCERNLADHTWVTSLFLSVSSQDTELYYNIISSIKPCVNILA